MEDSTPTNPTPTTQSEHRQKTKQLNGPNTELSPLTRAAEKRLREAFGKRLIQENKTMRDIGTVMEHPEFKQFFHRYFSDWDDARAMFMLMKVYSKVSETYPTLNGLEKVALLYELISNSDVRAQCVQTFCIPGMSPKLHFEPRAAITPSPESHISFVDMSYSVPNLRLEDMNLGSKIDKDVPEVDSVSESQSPKSFFPNSDLY